MKLAFSTIGCPEWNWDDALSAASDLGYDGVEIRGVSNELFAPAIPEFTAGKLAETKARLGSLRLAIPCLTSACSLGQAETNAAAMADATEYIRTAATLGTPYVRVMCESTAAPQSAVDEELVKRSLRELGALAASSGVTVLLETNGHYAKSERMAALFDEIGADGLGVLWDVHHPYRFFGESPEHTVGLLGEWIRYVHIKDSIVSDGTIRYKMLGQGSLPIPSFMQSLNDIGYDGWYTLEWVRRWDMSLEEPGIAFAHYISFMRDNG